MVIYPYATMTYIVIYLLYLHAWAGAYRGGRPPTTCSKWNCVNMHKTEFFRLSLFG